MYHILKDVKAYRGPGYRAMGKCKSHNWVHREGSSTYCHSHEVGPENVNE